MDAKRKKEIRERAEEVENIAEHYQLMHATYACQSLIRESIIRHFTVQYKELKQKIEQKAVKGLSFENEEKIKKELEEKLRSNGFHIDVAYINTEPENAARIVKIENAFVIYLSRSYADNIFTSDGKRNYGVIQEIRQLMAHELGHLILHTDDLLVTDSLQGSKLIQDVEKELEADYFRDELLEFRKKRNKEIQKDGGAAKLF